MKELTPDEIEIMRQARLAVAHPLGAAADSAPSEAERHEEAALNELGLAAIAYADAYRKDPKCSSYLDWSDACSRLETAAYRWAKTQMSPNDKLRHGPSEPKAAVGVSALLACFAVVHSNYVPLEVDSLWRHRVDADDRASYLGNSWRVRELQIQQHANCGVRAAPHREKEAGCQL